MRLKFILAFLILVFACALQSWFASMNIFMDLILATLITFAFFFDIWELLVFILFSVFVINWQPAVSLEIVLFAIIPGIVYASHKFFALIPAVAIPIAIIIGFLVFYLVIAPTLFLADWRSFLMDVFGGLIFGELVFLALSRTNL